MPGPVARLRVVAGATASLTIAAASVVVASGTSATAGGTSAATAPFVGPVAAPPAARPLIRTDGPLLLSLPGRPRRLAAAPRVMGPAVVAAPAPVRDEVAPDSGAQQVRRLQRLLNTHGADLRVDGAWGPATTAAVRRVQARLGLSADGRAGRATLSALRR